MLTQISPILFKLSAVRNKIFYIEGQHNAVISPSKLLVDTIVLRRPLDMEH